MHTLRDPEEGSVYNSGARKSKPSLKQQCRYVIVDEI